MKLFLAAALTAVCQGSAGAQTIVAWGDGAAGTDFLINNQAGTIEILRGNQGNYKFYAVDGTGTPGTGVINNITIDPAATGNFTLLIDHPSTNPDLPGALHLRAGNLQYAGGTCTITGIDLAGNLCADATSLGDNILAQIVSGDLGDGSVIRVAGSLSIGATAAAQALGIRATEIHGNIVLGNGTGTQRGMIGDIELMAWYAGWIAQDNP